MAKNDKINIGNCGEYFVAAELERRGFSVGVPMSNTPVFDLLAINNKDYSKQICIQVKTTDKEKPSWSMSKKNEGICGDHIFYVLVRLNGMNQPDYFIVPSKTVAYEVKTNHQNWLRTPGKKGQAHNDNDVRKFDLPEDSEFRDAWDLLNK